MGSASESTRQEQRPNGTWNDVPKLPSSAKLVAKVLEYTGTMIQQEIAEETLLPARTVRYAISRLDEANVIQSRFSFSDARKQLYTLDIDP